jgi:hypothetical protein
VLYFDFCGSAHPAGLFPAFFQLIQFLLKWHALILTVLPFAVIDPAEKHRIDRCLFSLDDLSVFLNLCVVACEFAQSDGRPLD